MFTALPDRRWSRWMDKLPGLHQWREARYERKFAEHASLEKNLYRGVFDSFNAAQDSIPTRRPIGYDNGPSADLYRERTRRVFINDYPMMFWLGRLFAEGQRFVFDLGGHIGVAYYAYQRFISYPESVRWIVCDVRAVNAAGVAWAAQHDAARRLSFVDHLDAASVADIFFAAGSLQYLDRSLLEILGDLMPAPNHLLLNSVPIHPSASYFTVQNMGTGCCAYRVTVERTFIDGLKAMGYVLRDRWENPHRACQIPFHPEKSLDRYFGFYFSRDRG